MIHMDDGHLKDCLESYRFPDPYTLDQINAVLRILKPKYKHEAAKNLSEYMFIAMENRKYLSGPKFFPLDQSGEISTLLFQMEQLLKTYKRLDPLYLLELYAHLQDDDQNFSINNCLLLACQKLNETLCKARIDTDATGWSKRLVSNWNIPRRGRGAPAKRADRALVTYLADFFKKHGTSASGKMRFIRAAIEPFGFTESSLTDDAIKAHLRREAQERP